MPDEETTELEESITRDATDGIQSASGDGQSMTQMPLNGGMEYLEHKESTAASAVGLGVRVVRLIRPGAVESHS